MPISGGIYAIKNEINGKWYIGATYDFEYRWADHRAALNSGRHRNMTLLHDWRKQHGQGFSFEILEEVTNENDLPLREVDWITFAAEKGTNLYNKGLTSGGLGHGPVKSYPTLINELTGEIIPAGDNLYRLCKEKELQQPNMTRLIRGCAHSYKGWVLAKPVCQVCREMSLPTDDDIVCPGCLEKIMIAHQGKIKK